MYFPPPSLSVFPVQHQQIFRRKKKLIKKKTKNPIVRNPPHQNWIQDSRLQKERRKKKRGGVNDNYTFDCDKILQEAS